jgi:beta-lactamase superfamily II metal-dependent hydrolase
MDHNLQIRTVNVELLRAGPPHNQLLSPLTQYLGVCGESGAGLVTLPYEHETFERRLRYLRYEEGDAAERLSQLRDTGVEMARLLASIPGLPGALAAGPERSDTLVHLRLVLSASELALLPFELSKVPAGPSASSENWLAIQTRPPVCITRHIRTVSSEGVIWPVEPRILFIAGEPDDVPFDQHRQILLEATAPFRYPLTDDVRLSEDGRREQFGDWLTILKDATFDDVVTECSRVRYTHVHILTHGAPLTYTGGRSFGLVLRSGESEPDVVDGERFASALASLATGSVHRPTVVTVASCDSGNVGSVITPAASFAHALHQAGIPLVIASQFPLSKQGSIAVAATTYKGLLWGENPWWLLNQIRSELHSRYTTNSHDWASLVVYEALPANLPDQLEAVRYQQARRAINAALENVDLAVREKGERLSGERHQELVNQVRCAEEHLLLDGHFAMECLGLRASSAKRLAQAEYNLARQEATPAERTRHLGECYNLLDRALSDYQQAARGFLVNEGQPVQRVATLHWVLVQTLSMAAVLGKELPEGYWESARLSAEMYLEHPGPQERAWAHGSLSEVWLLRLAVPGLDEQDAARAAGNARQHAGELDKLYPWRDEFPVKSTRRQFARYVEWWGDPAFAEGLAQFGLKRTSDWGRKKGLVETAASLVEILRRRLQADDEATVLVPGSGPASEASGNGKKPPKPKPTRQVKGVLGKEKPAGPFIEVNVLPAEFGDCLWIEYGDGHAVSRILIDCGTQSTWTRLRAHIDRLKPADRDLELFVMTHIDADHIAGAIPFLKDDSIGLHFQDIWFNGWKHLTSSRLGPLQGEIFSTLIQDRKLPWNVWRENGPIVTGQGDLPVCQLPGGLTLTLLSPTPARLEKLQPAWARELKRHGLTPGYTRDFRQFLAGTRSTSTDVDELAETPFDGDSGLPNGSTIAMLAEFRGKALLLTGDAHAPVLADSIRKLLTARSAPRLKVDCLKVPHHGSQNNLSNELLQLLDCRHYLVSTDGAHFNHPDREAIARIVKHGGSRPVIHFNYRSSENSVWERPDLQEKYGYVAEYPDKGSAGLVVQLT